MQAVILAAGDGGRLHPYTRAMPKALVPLRGKPIIAHVLDALACAGVDDALVVIGYHGDQLRNAINVIKPPGMRVRFARNDSFMTGNARSLWSAAGHVDGPFVLTMADHVVEPGLIQQLTSAADGRELLAVERVADHDERAGEATRAQVVDTLVVDLGKAIDRWNALDTGVFWCTPRVFDELTPEMRDGEVGAVFSAIARRGDLDAVDVTGRQWIDIDTEADLLRAEAMLGSDDRVA